VICRLVMTAVFVGLVGLVAASLPDIARYMKIREM